MVSTDSARLREVRGFLTGLDLEAAQAAIADLIRALGSDPDAEGMRDTPRRVAEMYAEVFSGMWADPAEFLQVTFDEAHDEMVILRDIPFYSMCEHHLMPFHGSAHVGYIPEGKVVGVSKLARVVEAFARRPQVQERLTGQIADCIVEALQPDGVAVVIEAEHLCMTMRGVRKPGSKMVTSAVRGHFRDRAVTRSEFLQLVRGS
jgi:GTP cyclohydrolase I